MHGESLRTWRKKERIRLVDARLAVPPQVILRWRHCIDSLLERTFPALRDSIVGFCWPIRNEYDARPLFAKLGAAGARFALPVVTGPGEPLLFREWTPDTPMAEGALGIPAPIGSRELEPGTLLLPLLGWDGQGYRLGYGGGFMDRTLSALSYRPTVVGVGYELGRMETIHPQIWDIPMDNVVTEKAVYRREPDGLKVLEPI